MPKLKTVDPIPAEDQTVQDDFVGPPATVQAADAKVRRPRLAGPGDEAAAISPALTLQQLLIDGWEDADPDDDGRRWAPGLTILVSGACAVVLWGLIIWAAVALFHIRLP